MLLAAMQWHVRCRTELLELPLLQQFALAAGSTAAVGDSTVNQTVGHIVVCPVLGSA
jgi:hypothetical protein